MNNYFRFQQALFHLIYEYEEDNAVMLEKEKVLTDLRTLLHKSHEIQNTKNKG